MRASIISGQKTPNAQLKKLAPDAEALLAMLNWIAAYVTEINTLPDPKRGVRLEVCAADEDNSIVVTRTGKDVPAAFFKCVGVGMKQLPRH